MRLSCTQGSYEWLELRKRHVTSTDASIVMGYSPFKDRETLMLQKIGQLEADEENDAMRRGTELEPVARCQYIRETGLAMFPAVYSYENFMMASVDGIDLDEKRIIEIKCGRSAAMKFPDIPSYYWVQMQHALWVTGIEYCDYCVYWDGELRFREVECDQEFIERMIEEEKKFYKEMMERRDEDNL